MSCSMIRIIVFIHFLFNFNPSITHALNAFSVPVQNSIQMLLLIILIILVDSYIFSYIISYFEIIVCIDNIRL